MGPAIYINPIGTKKLEFLTKHGKLIENKNTKFEGIPIDLQIVLYCKNPESFDFIIVIKDQADLNDYMQNDGREKQLYAVPIDILLKSNDLDYVEYVKKRKLKQWRNEFSCDDSPTSLSAAIHATDLVAVIGKYSVFVNHVANQGSRGFMASIGLLNNPGYFIGNGEVFSGEGLKAFNLAAKNGRQIARLLIKRAHLRI